MAKSKVSRKKLLKEPDEFITFTGRIIQFGKTYYKQLIGGLVAIFAIIAIGSITHYFSVKNENEASLLLSKAQFAYSKTLSSSTPKDALAKSENDFAKLIEKYSGKMAGKQGRLIFANICLDAKETERAIELYKESLNDWRSEPIIKNLILDSMGYVYEDKGDFKTAVKYFEEIRNSEESMSKAEATYNLGRIYAKLGDTKKSIKDFKKVKQDYPNFMYAQVVKDKINSED